ncbi:hypothetical protein MIND_01277500 [Mycena indigotica]|uniref:Uncharacterized protein n=1 Tax=Mycena indigotica TaxID=2126181 RepID=A0A8H6S322_9AGAR|nr:uncharacterized protein MIND_01277500 [Mycena indigotica]KAF7291330.1 hypothetical protein MIND_01277500 [Mycena indigotica]
MFKLILLQMLSLLPVLVSTSLAGATPVTTAAQHTYAKRDILAFYATQNWLQFMANLFAQNAFYGVGDGVPQLQNIANHLKNCSDAFDSANFAIASMVPAGALTAPVFAAADLVSTDQLFLPSTQTTISNRPPGHAACGQGVLRGGEGQRANDARAVPLGRRPRAGERHLPRQHDWRG